VLLDLLKNVTRNSQEKMGSRMVQLLLEEDKYKEQIFSAIEPNSYPLMNDAFGNFVIQKIFDVSFDEHSRALYQRMRGRITSLSKQVFGCRVVQKLIEKFASDKKIIS
jgi:hypothetical protein